MSEVSLETIKKWIPTNFRAQIKSYQKCIFRRGCIRRKVYLCNSVNKVLLSRLKFKIWFFNTKVCFFAKLPNSCIYFFCETRKCVILFDLHKIFAEKVKVFLTLQTLTSISLNTKVTQSGPSKPQRCHEIIIRNIF